MRYTATLLYGELSEVIHLLETETDPASIAAAVMNVATRVQRLEYDALIAKAAAAEASK